MNWRMISTLVYKDVSLLFRNRLFAPVTLGLLVSCVTVYFFMPGSVDETLRVGFYSPKASPVFIELMEKEGLIIQEMKSENSLKHAIDDGQYAIGIVSSGNLREKHRGGKNRRLMIYFDAGFPEELQSAVITLLQEVTYVINGQPMNIEADHKILGNDMTGMQVPLRKRLLPLFALFILMTETMGVATLIAEEREWHTLKALLITPLRIEGFMLSKGLSGIGVAFSQVVLVMAVIGGLRHQPFLVLGTLLSGSVLITGIGFMMAAFGKDMLSVSAWGLLALLILGIPSFVVLLPGVISGWVKFIPSFYLIDTLHQVVNLNADWRMVWPNLLMTFAFGSCFLWIGTMVLWRKLR